MGALEVRELTPGFGAEITGLVAAETLDDATCRELQQVFRERELLLIRDPAMDRRFQTYLCELLRAEGQPDPVLVDENASRQTSFYISNRRDGAAAPFGELMFHSDAMWSTEPYGVLSLWAEEVASPVTPTKFTSVTQAWDTLPDELRARLVSLEVEHTNQVQERGDEGERLLLADREERTTTTSIGHPNPRSGRTMLYVCAMMTSKVLGLAADESEALLQSLFEHIAAPERTWEHEWRDGDLVIWDNLAVQHARSDVAADGPVRTLRKAASPVVPAGVVPQQSYKVG
jgi:alpha-ketoglutarate-dependent taurine dioxygenase